jgi:NAD(P)-dependent dehydrogenase (short-subunit alcohol dehydrogenase family)
MNAASAGTVLVTGGTLRLGKAISDALRGRGMRVLTSSHRSGSGADIIVDLSEPSGPARLYLEAMRLAPDISAIVNNAAVFTGDAGTMRAVNLDAPMKLTMMLAGKEDRPCAVVNVLDAEIIGSDAIPDDGSEKSLYLRTKRELMEYTRKSACLFAGTLRVNAVAPGAVLAPVDVHEKAGETLLAQRPSPEDVADAVAYLIEARSVTGTVIPVDSGRHLLSGDRAC